MNVSCFGRLGDWSGSNFDCETVDFVGFDDWLNFVDLLNLFDSGEYYLLC